MFKYIIKEYNQIITLLTYIGLEPKSSQHNQVLSTTWANTFPHHES